MTESSLNLLYVLPTKFTDLISGHETYGFRIFDDTASLYDNTWESVPETNDEMIQKVFGSEDVLIQELLAQWAAQDTPIVINNRTWTVAQVEVVLGREIEKWQSLEPEFCEDEVLDLEEYEDSPGL